MSRTMQFVVAGLVTLIVLSLIVMVFSLSPEAWRLDALRAQVKYTPKPPTRVALAPKGKLTGSPTGPAHAPLTPTATISLKTPDAPTGTPTFTGEPTQSPTPLPGKAQLNGIKHEFQQYNSPGPANVSMVLKFWGWKGDQSTIADELKPNKQDRNVMPYELEAYVDKLEGVDAVLRVGGDLDTLKAFISSGFPVIVEKGLEGTGLDGWWGHYQVISGFDDESQIFTVQDSFKGPNQKTPYADLLRDWRPFNYTYLIVYPNERRQQVLDLLGMNAYDNFNYHHALDIATKDVSELKDRDLFFALFNQGSNDVALQDYANAAAAYDSAFANYEKLPADQRPWRMMWYQTGPYFAYYFTGRYSDVISLATKTLDAVSEPNLEESFYWRARAMLAMGSEADAIKDLQDCVKVHEGFQPCLEELNNLGITPAP